MNYTQDADKAADSDTITGTIDRFLYQDQESEFSVFTLQAPHQAPITVKGYLPGISIGQEVVLSGSWIFHPKFGKQFDAKSFVTKLPTTLVGLKKYLGSGLIKGIGPSYAEKLVNYFGLHTLKIIDEEPERLKEVQGIGVKRIEKIIFAWKDQREIAQIMVFLQDKNISPAYAAKIYKRYKQDSIAILHENPYRLAEDIWGIGFKIADEIAQKLDFLPHAPQRITAGVCYVLSQATSQGHLYVELTDLKSKTIILLGLELEHESLIKQALHGLYEKEKIKYITHENTHYLTLTQYYISEKNSVQRIKIISEQASQLNFNIDEIYTKLRTDQSQIYLNEDQQRGIMNCLQNKITVITGGPGTGKTTLIKKLLGILEDNNVSYKLAAPTGRAAKRIFESTGRHAETIHRLLEFDVASMGFKHNETNSLKLDFLIIDEASMIDIFLAYAILKALPNQAHLVLIGDIDQLPSVGAGNVLSDLIASQKISCTRLTHIFRQAQDSLIVVNAHKINKGEFPVSSIPDARHDFIFIKEENPEKVIDYLKRILFAELPKRALSLDNSIVLTPMNRGLVGTHSLNHMLQELLNPKITPAKLVISGVTYKPGDKVMQIRNNYDKKVFNGDIGIIDSIDHEDKQVLVNFSDQLIEYDFEEIKELVLAYAISIHKSQGSEYDVVIVPLFMQHFMLLQRNLLYTALTRAKKLCIFIGQPKALALAIKNTKGTERLTFLQKFLIEAL
jgi:exodeoxyribonuclease V alpha subunit